MHPFLITLPPAIAQSLNPYFKPAPTICRRCGTSGDALFHTLDACERLQQAKAQHDAGYLRASQVIKQASEAERAADDIAANRDKAAKAHAHQLHSGMLDQINDKTGAYQ